MQHDDENLFLRYTFNEDGKIVRFETRNYACTTYTYGSNSVPILPVDVRLLTSGMELDDDTGMPE